MHSWWSPYTCHGVNLDFIRSPSGVHQDLWGSVTYSHPDIKGLKMGKMRPDTKCPKSGNFDLASEGIIRGPSFFGYCGRATGNQTATIIINEKQSFLNHVIQSLLFCAEQSRLNWLLCTPLITSCIWPKLTQSPNSTAMATVYSDVPAQLGLKAVAFDGSGFHDPQVRPRPSMTAGFGPALAWTMAQVRKMQNILYISESLIITYGKFCHWILTKCYGLIFKNVEVHLDLEANIFIFNASWHSQSCVIGSCHKPCWYWLF